MKKIFAYIMLATISAACARMQDIPAEVNDAVAFYAESLSSRVLATQDVDTVKLAWSNGDQIGVFSSTASEGNYPYIALPDAADPVKAKFLASSTKMFYAESGSDYYAYYPYSPAAGSNPASLLFSLSDAQDQTAAGSLADAERHEYLVSRPYNTGVDGSQVRFAFYPLLPLVQLNLGLVQGESVAVPVVKMSLVSDVALAGDGTLDITSDTPALNISTPHNTITMAPKALTLTSGGNVPVHFVTLPGRHDALKLRLEAIDNSVCEIDLPTVSFAQGRNYKKEISCSYADFVAPDMVDVIPAALSCAAGEGIEFTFSGSAAEIDFWSGEKGHDIAYEANDRIELQPDSLSFMHATGAGYQTDAVTVRVSEDFSGEMTEAAVKAATWTDISDRFTFSSTAGPNHADNPFTKSLACYNDYFVNSGKKDITDCYGQSGKMYLAFFYHIDAYDATLDNSRTMHYLTRIEVPGQYSLAQNNTTLIQGSNYNAAEDKTNVPAWQTPKTELGIPDYPGFRFAAAFKPTSDKDAWAIANSPLVKRETNYGHDTPITVKESTQDMPTSFAHVFAKQGTYEVVFVVRRPRLDGSIQTVTKNFTITVN